MALNLLLNIVPRSPAFNRPQKRLQPLSKSTKLSHAKQCQPRASLESEGPVVRERRSGNYHPSIWDPEFIESTTSPYSDEHYKFRLEELKREVSRLIDAPHQDVREKLRLIDCVDRLGVAYHFNHEITVALKHILTDETSEIDDLFNTALRFRLLRLYGHKVTADVFEKFKEDEGDFKESLSRDARGLLSLYEASYLSVDGEDILDKAREFSKRHLEALKGSLEENMEEEIDYALDFPLRWRLSRIKAMDYIKFYEKEDGRNTLLLEFAKLDFNVLQSLHQAELRGLSKWWRDLGFEKKLGFTRDRIVELHVWGMGVSYEARLSKNRLTAAKTTTLVTCIDDIYDVYGYLMELEHFTEAVQRWDLEGIENLPDYMKVAYMALFNNANELAYESLKDYGVNIIPTLRKAWEDQCNAFMAEARWFHKGETPTLKEYLTNGWVSVGVPIILIHCFAVLRQDLGVSPTNFWEQVSKLVYWSSILVRLTDDLGTSTSELERGDVPKSIQCYIHESGESEEAAREHIMNLVIESWKNMNKECLATTLPREFAHAVCDFARVSHFYYKRGDGVGSSSGETKDRITSMYFIPL